MKVKERESSINGGSKHEAMGNESRKTPTKIMTKPHHGKLTETRRDEKKDVTHFDKAGIV